MRGYDIPFHFTYTAIMPAALNSRYHIRLLLLILFSNSAYGLEEKNNTGWMLSLDNDILAEADRDYTGGIALTLSGSRATSIVRE